MVREKGISTVKNEQQYDSSGATSEVVGLSEVGHKPITYNYA